MALKASLKITLKNNHYYIHLGLYMECGYKELSPAHTVRFWPRFGSLRQIFKILKDSYNPRLKSVVFDRWFDMFTDSRLMAVEIKFHLRRNSGSVRIFGAKSCSVTTPTMNVKLSPFFKTSYEQN